MAIAEQAVHPSWGCLLELRDAATLEVTLPPDDAVPEQLRDAIRRHRCNPNNDDLIASVDRVGHQLELSIARATVELTSRFRNCVLEAAQLHSQLVRLRAQSEWLRGFPWRTNWHADPYTVDVDGEGEARPVPQLLDALGQVTFTDERVLRLSLRPTRREDAYEPPPPPRRRGGLSRAMQALADAGASLRDVAETIPSAPDISYVSKWLAGTSPYPAALPHALEELIGEADAQRVLALIPGP